MKFRYKRRPQRSLRAVLTIWFLICSIAPLAFLTGYSVVKFERAIDLELSKRLEGNAREIGSILTEYRKILKTRRDQYLQNREFVYHLSVNGISDLKKIGSNWIRSDLSSSLTFFNRNGKMLSSLFKDSKGEVKEFTPNQNNAIFIADQNLEKMKKFREYSYLDFSEQKVSLILFSQVLNAGNKNVGYLEQVIDLDKQFLGNLKKRLGVEIMVIKKQGDLAASTHEDFFGLKKEFLQSLINPDAHSFFDMDIRGEAYGFLMYPVQWGQTEFYMSLGVSKAETKTVMKKVNYAFYSVVGGLILILILVTLILSNAILSPLDDLVQATQYIQSGESPVEIPIKSDTEIGLLTESFNEMTRAIQKAQRQLKDKISELESANTELKEAQSRLVHSSKMSSLGQLVAGVAHELNNPISYIYSNMSHLKDYGNRLVQLADRAEQNPTEIPNIKKELDIEFVKRDLPKLIASCEEGARRTRDIVIGLRNFSRLEEAKLKEVNIHESIDTTIELLSGEIKNRISIHKYYGDIPPVTCYASQINQVFMNILSNAAQAIDGQGNIWITTKKTVNGKSQECVSVSVQDSGKGIDPAVADKIFDPFFSTKGVGQGTGLGLSISYGIIEKHGGEIQVNSKPKVGTEFVITIPVRGVAQENEFES